MEGINKDAKSSSVELSECMSTDGNVERNLYDSFKIVLSHSLLEQIDISINTCQLLILATTRELAKEIQRVIKEIVDPRKFNCHACVGGNNIREEMRSLEAACHIVVGTPGRLLDMINRKALQTNKIELFVLFEFNNFLRSTFEKAMLKLISELPSDASVILLPENRFMKLSNLKNSFEAKISKNVAKQNAELRISEKKVAKQNAKLRTNNSVTENVSQNEDDGATGGQQEWWDDNTIENSFINYIRSKGIMQQIEVSNNSCQVLILASTRELVTQIQQIIKKCIFFMKLDGHIYVGDTNIREEIRDLEVGFHIIVGTPDRVYDIRALNVYQIKHLIIYEFQKCLSSTYKDQMRCVIDSLPANVKIFLLPENCSYNFMNLKYALEHFQSTGSETTMDVTKKKNHSTSREDMQARYAEAAEAIAEPTFSRIILQQIDTTSNSCQVLILVTTVKFVSKIQSLLTDSNDGETNDEIRNKNLGYYSVGTPDCVFDMIQQKVLSTEKIKFFILDEVDKMFFPPHKSQFVKVLNALPLDVQAIILSPASNNWSLNENGQLMLGDVRFCNLNQIIEFLK